eukprot:148840_1
MAWSASPPWAQANDAETSWICSYCSLGNSSITSDCIACFAPKPNLNFRHSTDQEHLLHGHADDQSTSDYHSNYNQKRRYDERRQSTYISAINMGFSQHYIQKALNLYEESYGRNVCPSVDLISEIIHQLQQSETKSPPFTAEKATELIVSILTEHKQLTKKALHQQIKLNNNDIHWVDSFQKTLGSLKHFVSKNAHFDVQIDFLYSNKFSICLATEKQSNDRDALEKEITQLKLTGNLYFRQQNYKMAIKYYTTGINHVKDDESFIELYQCLLSNRAKCFYHETELQNAFEDTQKCIAVRDGSLLSYKAHYTQSEILIHLHKYTEATKHCDHIINYNNAPLKSISAIITLQERATKLKTRILDLEKEYLGNEMCMEVLQDKLHKEMVKMRKVQTEHHQEMEAIKQRLQKYIEANDSLKEETVVLNERLKLLNGSSQKINTLDIGALSELESKLQNGLSRLQKARNALLDRKFNCVVCLDAPKNILTNGCNHIVLCQACETKLVAKICPMCQKPYQTVKKVHI